MQGVSWIETIIISLIQGFAEVFPISSSGHVSLTGHVFLPNPLTLPLAVALHVGSFLAIAVFFRRTIRLWTWFMQRSLAVMRQQRVEGLGISLPPPGELRIPWYFLASVGITAVAGFIVQRSGAADYSFRNGFFVAALLSVNGLAVLAVALCTQGERRLLELTLAEWLIIGTVHGTLGALPGISRLGMAICTALMLGVRWRDAYRLGFMLALPAIAGGFLLSTPFLPWSEFDIFKLMVSLIVVFSASLIGLTFLQTRLLERRTLYFFGLYCLMAGLTGLVYFLTWT